MALIEILIAGTVLVIASLGLAASVSSGHRLAVSLDERGLATETLQRLVERLRADPDWDGLYARLVARTRESDGDTALARLDVDTSLPTFPLSAYYSDLVSPSSLGAVTALVQVPVTAVGGVGALRESATAPRYGLPHDLNGDGTVDAASRALDYRSIPVVVRIRWQRAGQAAQEVLVGTWLRGDR
jgi:hypothetical protein